LSSERSTFTQQRNGSVDSSRQQSSIDPVNVTINAINSFVGNTTRKNLAKNPVTRPRSATAASSSTTKSPERPPLPVGLLQWGSDPNFKFTGYQPPSKEMQLGEELMEKRVTAMLAKADSRSTTAMNTAVNSPIEMRNYPSLKEYDEESGLVSPSKRRKSAHKRTTPDDDDEFQDSSSSSNRPASAAAASATATTTTSPKIKSKKDLQSPTSSKLSKKKKKKQQANLSRKENLSEAQKRENHIQSEQKRRNLIREGFEDLCNLVPDLRGGGYSKSAILIHAASFLEQLDEGNKFLELKVKELEGLV